jgi:hypothetical protein
MCKMRGDYFTFLKKVAEAALKNGTQPFAVTLSWAKV